MLRREENELMREKILDAVIICKAEADGADVSLSQVAFYAGISERTLNRYFPDKELLLYEAAIKYLKGLYEKFADEYNAADKTGLNGLQRLIMIIQMQIEHNKGAVKGEKIFVKAYTTALRTAVYRELPVSEYDAKLRNIVYKCVEDGVADGSIRSDVTSVDIYLLISSNYMGLVERLIYYYSVDFIKEEKEREMLLVFNRYIDMLAKYLSNG